MDRNPKLRKLFALRYLDLRGWPSSKDFSAEVVEWAISELVDGNITESRSILAGMTPPVHWQELEFYIQRALDESGLSAPPEEECLLLYARDIAGDIVSGTVAPVAGCSAIYRIALALDYPDELMEWVYLDDGLEPGTYPELTGAALDAAIVRQAGELSGTT